MTAHRADRIKALGLREEDFAESFCRSSGPGGQNVNKVSTAVELKHGPTGLRVKVQDERTQGRNRELAWNRLLDLIEGERLKKRQAARDKREKARRRNRPRPASVKRRMVESKRHRSKIKALRKGRSED